MFRSHFTAPVLPARTAPVFTEEQAHIADMARHRAKVEDPYRQHAADEASCREVQLRQATGQVF